jgi:hypothetical protein
MQTDQTLQRLCSPATGVLLGAKEQKFGSDFRASFLNEYVP